jgi:hypothetical protein
MTRHTCRSTAGIIDRIAADETLSIRQREHVERCARCAAVMGQGAWLTRRLPLLASSLATESIPADVLDMPMVSGSLAPLQRWIGPVLAASGIAAAILGAAVIGSQLSSILGPAREGAGLGEAPAETPLVASSASPLPRDPSADCGFFDGPFAADDANAVVALGDLPRVATEQHGTTVVSLFAAPRGEELAATVCTWFTQPGATASASGSGIVQEVPSEGPIRPFTTGRAGSPSGLQTAYAGSIDPVVARVSVERNEGGPVDAIIGNGYFLATWPGEAHATGFTAYGTDGQVLAAVGNNGWDYSHDGGP